MCPEAWIQLDWGAEDPAVVRDLVAELHADWEVRERTGFGVDPVTLVTVIAVPFSAFFIKFLDVAAVDAYERVKEWIKRMIEARSYSHLELRDPRLPDSPGGMIRLPPHPTEEDFRQLLPPLTAAMVRRGAELERFGDTASALQAKLWFERAFYTYDRSSLEAACRLVVLLRRAGDPVSRRDAATWYQRAIDLELPGSNEERAERVAAWVAHLEGPGGPKQPARGSLPE